MKYTDHIHTQCLYSKTLHIANLKLL